jgi:hypothetical protein
VDFYEGDAIENDVYSLLHNVEDDLDSILLSLVASTIPKLWTFKPLRRVQLFKRLEDLDKILCGGDDTEGGVDHSKMVNV